MVFIEIINVFITTGIYLYIVFSISSIKMINKKNIAMFFIIGTIFFSLRDLILFLRVFTVVVLTIFFLVYIYKMDFYKSIIFSSISYIILMIGDLSVWIAIDFIGRHKYVYDSIKDNFKINLIVYAIMMVICQSVLFIFFKLKKISSLKLIKSKGKIINALYVVFTLILIIINYAFIAYIVKIKSNTIVLFYVLISIAYFGINIYEIHTNEQYIAQKFENERLKLYSNVSRDYIESIRKFRHDYANIMFSINGYIENNDMDGLKDYFNTEVVKENNIMRNKSNILLLERIKNPAVKGIISSKVVEAQSKQVNLNIKVSDEIDEIPMKVLDLCRILGIFLDNAIEAACESEYKIVNFTIYKNEDCFELIIENSFKGTPRLNGIFENGVSTKGVGRGIGLSNAADILRKYKNILLNTIIENDLFKQDMILYYS